MQIPVRDLKPGDILPEATYNGGFGSPSPRCVVLYIAAAQPARNMFDIVLATLDHFSITSSPVNAFWNGEAKIEVERPQLTKPQEYAGHMLALLKRLKAVHITSALDSEISGLVKLMEPPAPPTMQEALAIVSDIAASNVQFPPTDSIVDRARKLLARVPRKDA